jgi:hypothetical protein
LLVRIQPEEPLSKCRGINNLQLQPVVGLELSQAKPLIL